MRKSRPFFLVGCLVCLFVSALPALGQEEVEVLTNADVVRLTESGLPASVIVAKIQTSWTDFDTSVDALVALSEANVAPEVLEAMANAGVEPPSAGGDAATPDVTTGTGASQVAKVATNFEGTPCERPGIFLAEEDAMVDLERTQATATKTGSGVLSSLTYGIKSTKAKALIRGARSQIRTGERRPTFYFCFEETEAGLSYQTAGAVNPSEFVLIAFDVLKKKDQRSFVTGKVNLWTGASGGSPPKQLRRVEYEKLVPGVYEVTAERLQPGEYAFYYGGQAIAALNLFGPAIAGGASGALVPSAGVTQGPSPWVFAFGVD